MDTSPISCKSLVILQKLQDRKLAFSFYAYFRQYLEESSKYCLIFIGRIKNVAQIFRKGIVIFVNSANLYKELLNHKTSLPLLIMKKRPISIIGLLALIVSLFISCEFSQEKDQTNVLNINLKAQFSQNNLAAIDQIVSNIEYIPLETTEHNLVGRMEKYAIQIIIFSYQMEITYFCLMIKANSLEP